MQIENRKKYNWKLICINYASSIASGRFYNKEVVLTATKVRKTINVSLYYLYLFLFTAGIFCVYVGLNI